MDSTDNAPVERASPWLLVFAFGVVFIEGLMLNHIAVLMPVLEKAYQLDERTLGLVPSLAFASVSAALFLSGYGTEWLRPKRSGIFAIFVMGCGCLIMGTAPSFKVVLFGLMVFHFGMHWILAVQGAVIADYFPETRQRLFFLAMAMMAAGAIIGPPAIGLALEKVVSEGSVADWGRVYIWLGFTNWGLLVILLLICGDRIAPLTEPSPRKQLEQAKANSGTESTSSSMWDTLISGVFNQPALYLLGIIVMFDNLALINVLAWLGVMVDRKFAAGPDEIGFLTSLMAAGVLVGRIFMASFVSGRVSDRILLGSCYGTSMLVFCAMLVAPSMKILYVLYFIMAFFMSAQAAATYAIGADKLRERAAVGIPMIDALGSIGAIVAPLVMGGLATQVGLDRALWLVPAFGAMVPVICFTWEWLDKGEKKKQIDR